MKRSRRESVQWVDDGADVDADDGDTADQDTLVAELKSGTKALGLQGTATQSQLDSLEAFVYSNVIELAPWGHEIFVFFREDIEQLMEAPEVEKEVQLLKAVDNICSKMFVDRFSASKMRKTIQQIQAAVSSYEFSIYVSAAGRPRRKNTLRAARAVFQTIHPEIIEVGLDPNATKNGGGLDSILPKNASSPEYMHIVNINDKRLRGGQGVPRIDGRSAST